MSVFIRGATGNVWLTRLADNSADASRKRADACALWLERADGGETSGALPFGTPFRLRAADGCYVERVGPPQLARDAARAPHYSAFFGLGFVRSASSQVWMVQLGGQGKQNSNEVQANDWLGLSVAGAVLGPPTAPDSAHRRFLTLRSAGSQAWERCGVVTWWWYGHERVCFVPCDPANSAVQTVPAVEGGGGAAPGHNNDNSEKNDGTRGGSAFADEMLLFDALRALSKKSDEKIGAWTELLAADDFEIVQDVRIVEASALRLTKYSAVLQALLVKLRNL